MPVDHNPTNICYLCNKELGSDEIDRDHVFQQQFVARQHPKAKGFDYAGVLPVHRRCNNLFGGAGQGPETMCKKALRLIEVLKSNETLYKVHRDNPNIRIAAISSSSLPEFTEDDIKYFKFNNAQDAPYENWTSEKHLADKQQINPFITPVNIALSTLAKSSAAFLVKRHAYPLQLKWRILAIPYVGSNPNFDLGSIFGETKPLEMGIKLWVKQEGNGWFLAYKYNRVLTYFVFEASASDSFQKAASVFQKANCLFYDSDSLLGLIGYEWNKNTYPLQHL